MIDYPRKGCVQGNVTSLNFGKCGNISKTVKTDTPLQLKTIRKSYVAYRMVPLRVTFSDLKGHFCYLKPFCPSAMVVRVHDGALAEQYEVLSTTLV